jgi:protein TonB
MAPASAIHQLIEVPAPRKEARTVAPPRVVTPYEAKFDLSQSLLDMNQMKHPRRFVDVLVAVVLHVVIIGTPIFLSLWFTNTLDLRAYTQTMLIDPPPPPPPPPAPTVVRAAVAPRRVFITQGKLLAPSYVPKEVAMLKEAPPPEDAGAFGVEGGVPGGVPGGQMGGVIGGIVGGIATSKPAPPPPVKSKVPIRIGGRIQPPRAISTAAPIYPPLARATRLQGTVIISAILSEQGDVVEMKIVSGPVLLYQAALNAVSQWKYEPTYLNGVPVSVEMNIIVNFQLNQQ